MEVKGGVEAEASGGVVFAKAEVKGNGRQRIVYMVVRVRFRSKTRKDRTFWQKDPSFYANILCKILMMCELYDWFVDKVVLRVYNKATS